MSAGTFLLDLTLLHSTTRQGGVGRYLTDLSRGLYRLLSVDSHAEKLLGLVELTRLGRFRTEEDIPAALAAIHGSGTFTDVDADWAFAIRLGFARAMRKLRPDVAHIAGPWATPLGKLPCKRIATCHDLIPIRYPAQYIGWQSGFRVGREWLDYRRFHSADHLIAVSETAANDAVTLLGIPAARITVVYNGVDLHRWSPVPLPSDAATVQRHGLSARPFLLYVGGSDWRKNVTGSLDALSLARKQGHELDLAWAARLSDERARKFRAEAAERGVGDRVHVLGFVPDDELEVLYRHALALAFASRAEGFGYPLVEAMASGCPVITSNRSSLAEVAGDAALQVDPERPEAMAEGIVTLLGSEAERQRYREKGLLQARQFTLERTAERTLEVYRAVAGL